MIKVYGYVGEISESMRRDVDDAALVVGGTRHLDALDVLEEKRIVLGKIDPAVAALHDLQPGQTAVVIASGDPLFYGIGKRLAAEGLDPVIVPAPTSIALAFARIAEPWDDATLVSAHAGSLEEAVEQIRGAAKAAVLTARGKGLPELAAAFPEREFVLAERLGESDERIRRFSGAEAGALDPSAILEPNVVLIFAEPAAAVSSQVGEPAHPTRDNTGVEDAVSRAQDETAAPRVGQIVNSPASRRHADAIDHALGITSTRYEGSAKEGLPKAWAECDLIVSHLATGATTRIIAPLLASKRTDPGVVVVDEAGRFAIPLVGGHAGGANELARQIADALGATPVVSTATDSIGLPALDQLGWAYEGDVAGVTQAIINDRPVTIERTQPWPMPPLPKNVAIDAEDFDARIRVTDQIGTFTRDATPTVVLHPKSLVVGMGCNAGTPVETLRALLEETLHDAGLALESVTAMTTHEVKAGELGLIKLCAQLDVPLIPFAPEILAAQEVPTPSATVEGHVGTPSVAEASVLARGAELIVPKHKNADATCAIGRMPARGRLSVVGLGPGARDLLSPRAVDAIRNATVIEGYGPYVAQIKDLARPGTKVTVSKMGTEEERTARAIAAAREGKNVVLVCSGDPSMYAMASPTLEQGTEGIDVQIVPGITASLAASSILGAPLGHDNCTISLSDLHTPWEVIEQRLQAAAEGDFVVALYNPRSRTRRMHLPRALEILGAHRPSTTPVAVVRQATRPQESFQIATMADFDVEWVDMNSIVIVGSSKTTLVPTGSGELRMVTPRDYQWMQEEK